MIPLKYIHKDINIFLLLLNRIDRWCKDELIVRWREHPLTVRNDELSWSCSLYREGLWRHRVFAWEMLRSDSLSSTLVNKIHVHVYGLRWVLEKTAYMHILVNNNFIESMEWNTASHCQPNLSTYIVDCFESVSSLSTVNKLFIYQYLWLVVSTPRCERLYVLYEWFPLHAVRDCMYYMSDFLHYV